MNILNLIFSFNVGGAEKMLVDILGNWQNKEDNLHLCIINDDYDSELLDEIDKDSVKIHLLNRIPKSSKLSKTDELRKIIKENNIEAIHCHNNDTLKYLIISRALKRRHNVFLTIHDTNIYNRFSKADIILHKMFLTKVIAISKSVQKSITDINKKKGFTKVVYNGVDHRKFIKKSQKQTGRKNILCVARIVPDKKGQDVLIKAISELENKENVICSFAGGNPSGQDNISKLKLMAQDLGLKNEIEFLGNRSDVARLLSNTDLFVLPSNYEGFGIVIIEAMMAKVPVIASDIDGPKELISDGENGYLFEAGNHEDLANKIETVIQNDNTDLIENAYNTAVEKFSIANMINSLRDVYTN